MTDLTKANQPVPLGATVEPVLLDKEQAPPSGALLEVRNLAVTFRSEAGPVEAVRGLDFQLERGEVLGIVGESGSGKSVSSMAIMGLLPNSARVTGSVLFEGKNLLGRS